MMSGRTGFQSRTSNNYQHASGSGSYQQVGNSEAMWDDEPSSSVAHVTQVFYNQSLTNNVGNEWDAWEGNYTPKTRNIPESRNKAGNFEGHQYQRDHMLQSSASGQCPDGFGHQNELHNGSGDVAPFDMKISSRQIGLVIGKGGSRIRELQASSGAKIHVKRDDVDAYGMVLITLDGDVAARSSAKRMIDDLIENDSYNPSAGRLDDNQNRQTAKHFSDGGGARDSSGLTIASNMLGAVIGRGGQKIREIQDKTQTRIDIGDRSGPTAEVTITGSEDGRERARQLIEDVIQAESESGYIQKSERPEFTSQQKFGSGSGDRLQFIPNSERSGFGGSHENDSHNPNVGRWDDNQNRQTAKHFSDGGGARDSSGLTIASNMLGAVIGRGGQKIREIQDKTQTRIHCGDRSGPTAEITITGSEDGREQARQLIEDVIQSESGYMQKSGDRSQFIPNSERSGFGDSHTGNQQRSGFGHSDDFEPAQNSFGDSRTGGEWRSGFGNSDRFESTERSFDNRGRSSFGNSGSQRGFGGASHGFGSASPVINWDHVKQLSQEHEEQKWKGYPPIKKNFYIEDADVANMEPEEIAAIREENNNIMVSCDEDNEVCVPNPVRTFDEGFLHYPDILSELKRAGFSKPSPIQMQGWPIALQGLDLIGIAQTGTGKTLAFLLPAFIHIEGQPVPRGKRGGPNVLVLSPTRELALQVSRIDFVCLL